MDANEQIQYEYKFGVLEEKNNSKYSKREKKYGMDIVAIKIQNLTDLPIDVNKHLSFKVSGREAFPLESSTVTDKIKQKVWIYALYSLIWADFEPSNDSNVPIPLGLPISIGNIMVANTGNKRFRSEFEDNNLVNKVIQPRSTIYGLVAFRDIDHGPLILEVVKSKN